MNAGGQEGQRPVDDIKPRLSGDGQGPRFADAARPEPADERLGHVAADGPAEVAGLGNESSGVPADIRPAPELADERAQKRKEEQEPEPDRTARKIEQEQDRGEEGQEPEEDEEERRGGVLAEKPEGLRVGHVPDLPSLEPGPADGRPEAGPRQQLDVVMRDVRQRIPVCLIGALERLERARHAGERPVVRLDVGFESPDIPAVELDQAPPGRALDDELEVGRALRQERQEGHARPEIDGHETLLRIAVRLRPLEGVRLALHRPPFILAGELGSAHVVHQADEVLHERPLGPVLRRAEPIVRTPGSPIETGEEVVVDLVAPQPAVHPFAELAAAAEDRIDQRGQDVDDGPLRAEPGPGAPPDELLPQGSRPCGVRIDLGRERPLEADPVEGVADEAAEAGDGDEDLEGVGAPGFEPLDRPLGGDDVEDLDPIDLAGEAAADVAFDLELDPARPVRPDAADVVFEDLAGLVPPDAHRAEE